jgi:PadR family transcriptional regulator, regulatory protein AphA
MSDLSLKHALLGLLNYQNMTGYQLKKYFDESVGSFWKVSLSQIYPTLNQMNEQGMLMVEVIQQDSSPNLKLYSITNKGKEELLNWLSQPVEPEHIRSTLPIKLFFSSNIRKEQVISQLEQLMELSKKNLKISKEGKKHIEESHLCEDNMNQEAFFWSLTADYGIKHEEFFIAWCEECIEKIKVSMCGGLQ